MKKQVTVQQALKSAFPEFNDKKQLIDYYVSFDFPQKQMKMVNWWQKVIEFIIQYEHKAYITYPQLASFVTMYNLKPTPLQSIIDFLAKKDVLAPQNEYDVKQSIKQAKNEKKESFFSTMMSYVTKPAKEQVKYFKFIVGERIFSKKIKEFKKNQIKKILSTIFPEHCRSISLYKLLQNLEAKVELDRVSLIELLRQLDRQQTIVFSENGNQSYVLYSHNQENFKNKEWIEIQRMKFCLRQEIQKFEFMVSKQQEKVAKLKERAKQQVVSNRKSAFATCKEIKEKEKKIENISTRKRILDNQITQLQYNQMNKTTIDLLEQAHKVYQQTVIDPAKLDQVMEKNMEIEITNKQNNEKIESFASREEQYEEEVDEMLRDLEKEVMRQPEKQKVKVEIPMEIESKQSESGTKMEIQYPPNKKVINELS